MWPLWCVRTRIIGAGETIAHCRPTPTLLRRVIWRRAAQLPLSCMVYIRCRPFHPPREMATVTMMLKLIAPLLGRAIWPHDIAMWWGFWHRKWHAPYQCEYEWIQINRAPENSQQSFQILHLIFPTFPPSKFALHEDDHTLHLIHYVIMDHLIRSTLIILRSQSDVPPRSSGGYFRVVLPPATFV